MPQSIKICAKEVCQHSETLSKATRFHAQSSSGTTAMTSLDTGDPWWSRALYSIPGEVQSGLQLTQQLTHSYTQRCPQQSGGIKNVASQSPRTPLKKKKTNK